MIDKNYNLSRYAAAAELLPESLKKTALMFPDDIVDEAEEFRLRVGKYFSVLAANEEKFSDIKIGCGDIYTVLRKASEMSAYSVAETVKDGYITVENGFRIGLCGTAVIKDGTVTSLRDLSSVVIRISRECRGAAEPVFKKLTAENSFKSTLIIAPPGGGKTTLLRDIIRMLSDGSGNFSPRRVAVADERSEIGVVWRGIPQMDLGNQTDIMSGCPKSKAMLMMLRAMNPQIIAVDEVTAADDIEAMITASNCGAEILATAHGNSLEEIYDRPIYKKLLDTGIFKHCLIISKKDGVRNYEVTDAI